ncbi:hypothetical protein EZS27_010210 [termite gut metagenome]|uniref:Uncharacterized protein n=1 Tax=termite gut metagenome TaxID=433724 RepID=A0A5J4S7F9_9ZZZZ
MRKRFLTQFLTVALLSLGFVACDNDDSVDQPIVVDLSIQVEFASEYRGISLTDLSLEGVTINFGETELKTDVDGKAAVSVDAGSYQFSATANRLIEAQNEEGSNGNWFINFQGTKLAEVSKDAASITITLNGTGTPEFTAFGSIVFTSDVIHVDTLGAELDIRPLFTPSLAPGDARQFALTFEVIEQPKKKETGNSNTGDWISIPDVYQFQEDGYTLEAIKSLPNAFIYNGTSREVSPAVVRATLTADNQIIAIKDVGVVQDKVPVELIAIELVEDPASTGSIQSRLIPGTNTFTVGLPYTPSASGATGCSVTKSGTFKGTYSDGTINTNLADKLGTLDIDHEPQPGDPEYREGGSWTSGLYMWYDKFIVLEAENSDKSPIAGAAEANSGKTKADNTGRPISSNMTYSNGRVNAEQFYIGDPENNPTNIVGETGTFYVYPYGTSRDDFRTLKLTTKTVLVTGITQSPESFILAASPVRRFKVDTQTAIQAAFYAYTTVSEGPARPYSSSGGAEGDNGYMLVVAGSWNQYDGGDILEGIITSTAQKNNSLLKPDQNVNTVLDNYAGLYQVQLSAKGKTAPANTTVTFKVCPKKQFTNGVSNPLWTVDVVTKIYAE